MPEVALGNAGVLFAGRIHLDVFDADGNPAGYSKEINATKLEITSNKEDVNRTVTQHLNYGQARGTVSIPAPTTMTLACDQLSAPIWQAVFLAVVSDYSQASGSMAAVPVTVRLDRWVELPFENLAASGELVQDDTDTTTFVVDVDYKLSHEDGLMMALSSGDMTDKQVIHYTGDYEAESGSLIEAGVLNSVTCSIRGTGRNLETKKKVKLFIPRAVLAPTVGVDMMSRAHWVPELGGNVDLAEGRTSLYEMKVLN